MSNLDNDQLINWIDISQAGIFLDVRVVNMQPDQVLLLDRHKKLSPDNLERVGFEEIKFESHPQFDGHIYHYKGYAPLTLNLFCKDLGIPIDFIKNFSAKKSEIKKIFDVNCNTISNQRLDLVLNSATPLGYNQAGFLIYGSQFNRFYINDKNRVIYESPYEDPNPIYLRAATYGNLKECLRGYLHELRVTGKKQTHDDFVRFLALITLKENQEIDVKRVTDTQILMAEEALEIVLVQYMSELNLNYDGFSQALIMDQLKPVKAMRNNMVRALQQYSTPLPLSIIAQRLLVHSDHRTNAKYKVLEPTIGNGSLISLISRDSNATIFGLELDKKRVNSSKELTKLYDSHVFIGDATTFNFEENFRSRCDYVISNPPFGTMNDILDVGLVRVTKLLGRDPEPRLVSPDEKIYFATDKLDQAIIIRALNARNDQGRAVFIFGADDMISKGVVGNKTKSFLNHLYKHYHVEGLTEISGGLYASSGATLNIRMMIVGDRKSDQELLSFYDQDVPPTRIPVLNSYEDVWDWANTVLHHRLNPSLSKAIEVARTNHENHENHELDIRKNPPEPKDQTVITARKKNIIKNAVFIGDTSKPSHSFVKQFKPSEDQKIDNVTAIRTDTIIEAQNVKVVGDISAVVTAPDYTKPNEKELEQAKSTDARVILNVGQEQHVNTAVLSAAPISDNTTNQSPANSNNDLGLDDDMLGGFDVNHPTPMQTALSSAFEFNLNSDKPKTENNNPAAPSPTNEANASQDEQKTGESQPEVSTAPAGFLPKKKKKSNSKQSSFSAKIVEVEETQTTALPNDSDIPVLDDIPPNIATELLSAEVDEDADADADAQAERERLESEEKAERERLELEELEAATSLNQYNQDAKDAKDKDLQPESESESESKEKVETIQQVNGSKGSLLSNEYQVRYIPMSKASSPIAMIPKNQVNAINEANLKIQKYISDLAAKDSDFSGILDEYPTSVDAYVAYKLKYDDIQALSDALACEQVDAMAHIIMRFDTKQPVLIGDQTGVGKGRIAAATLRYGAILGNTPVFLTDTAQLLNDIWRDIEATDSDKYFKNPFIFNDKAVIYRFNTDQVLFKGVPLDKSLKSIPKAFDLVLATYSQFNRPNMKRELLSDHINADTVLVMDESHRAAALNSKTSLYFLDVLKQTKLVCFQSATGVKRPENLEFYNSLFPETITRADIQSIAESADGPILEFISEALVDSSAMIRREQDLSNIEVITYTPVDEEAKRYHKYSDALSTILTLMVKYSKDVRADALVNISNDQNAKKALDFSAYAETVQGIDNRMRLTIMNFGSRMYQIQKQFLLAIKTESTCQQVIKALDNFQKPVIGLENTGESLFNILMEEKIERFIHAAKNNLDLGDPEHNQQVETLSHLLKSIEQIEEKISNMVNSPTGEADSKEISKLQKDLKKLQKEQDALVALHTSVLDELPQFRDLLTVMLNRIDLVTATDEYGNSYTKKLSEDLFFDQDKKPLPNPYKLAIAEIQEKIDQYPELPLMPLDVIRDRVTSAGYTIDEISGRSFNLSKNEQGKWLVQPQKTNTPDAKIIATAKFQSGELDAMIITRSGATGISLHAAKSNDPNKMSDHLRQRVLFFLQKPENASDTMQMVGRVGRRGEHTHPIIATMDSGIPSETRMHLMMMRKLSTLSANVSANSDTKLNENEFPDMLNHIGNAVALEFLRNNTLLASNIDVRLDLDDSDHRMTKNYYINQLLSKLILLPINQQEQIYYDLTNDYNDRIKSLDLLGKNPLKTNFFDVKAQVSYAQPVKENFFNDPSNKVDMVNPFDMPVEFKELEYIEHIKPYKADDLKVFLEESDKILLNRFHQINPNISSTAIGFHHYILSMEAAVFQKFEALAKQRLFTVKGDFKNQLLVKHANAIFNHFGFKPGMRREQMLFRDPLDHGLSAYQKISEAIYLTGDTALIANFDRMYQLLRDLRLIETKHKQVVNSSFMPEKDLPFHGALVSFKKPSLFDDVVNNELGVLASMDLPALRPSALTPSAIKLNLIYPGDKQLYKIPLLTLSNLKATDEFIQHSFHISEQGRSLLNSIYPENKYDPLRISSSSIPVEFNVFSKKYLNAELLRDAFNRALSGDVLRNAVVLTGNMFKAYNLTKSLNLKYSSIIYTDSDGLRNRGLLLPADTPRSLFTKDLENKISFKQVLDVSKYIQVSRENAIYPEDKLDLFGTSFNISYLDSSIKIAYINPKYYSVTVESYRKQLNRFMTNHNVFQNPLKPDAENSLNLVYVEAKSGTFKFDLSFDKLEPFLDHLESKLLVSYADLKHRLTGREVEKFKDGVLNISTLVANDEKSSHPKNEKTNDVKSKDLEENISYSR